MKPSYEDPIKSIYQSIRSRDYDTLSDVLDHFYNSGGRSAGVKSAICFGYKVLAGEYGQGSPVDALQANDRARQMFPSDKGLLQDEIGFLFEFIDKNTNKVTEKDIDQVGMMIKLIKIKVPKSSSVMADSVCEPLVNRLERIKSDTELKETSNIYQVSEPMMYNLYSDLTEQERNEKIAIIILKTIEDMDRIDYLKKNKKKPTKKSVTPKP